MNNDNTALAVQQDGLLVKDGLGNIRSYPVEQILGNVAIVPEGLTDPHRDALAFMAFCTMYGANPFAREAYMVPFNTKVSLRNQPEKWETRAAPVLGLEYWHRMANESGRVEGIRKYFIDKDFAPVKKTAPLAGNKPEPGEIVGCVCEVHLSDRKFPVESVVLLEEVDSGKGQLWRENAQKKHGLEVRCEYRAIKEAISPQVGLPQMSAAEAMQMEARVVNMEIVGDGAPQEGAAPALSGPSTEEFVAWRKDNKVKADELSAAREACGLASVNWPDFTPPQYRMVMDAVQAARQPKEPEVIDAEWEADPPNEDPAPSADLPDESEMREEFYALTGDTTEAHRAWGALEGPDAQLAALETARKAGKKKAEQPTLGEE